MATSYMWHYSKLDILLPLFIFDNNISTIKNGFAFKNYFFLSKRIVFNALIVGHPFGIVTLKVNSYVSKEKIIDCSSEILDLIHYWSSDQYGKNRICLILISFCCLASSVVQLNRYQTSVNLQLLVIQIPPTLTFSNQYARQIFRTVNLV